MVVVPATFGFCMHNAGFGFGGDVRLKKIYCEMGTFKYVEWSKYEATHEMSGSRWADPLSVMYEGAQPSESLAPLFHLSPGWI